MTEDKPQVVMPLLAVAVIANLFLFSVAFSNASFAGTTRALPDPFAAANFSKSLDGVISEVAADITATASQTASIVKPQVVAFLGLSDYKFGMPRHTALNPNPQLANSAGMAQGAVLGASTVNPDYESTLSFDTGESYSFEFRW